MNLEQFVQGQKFFSTLSVIAIQESSDGRHRVPIPPNDSALHFGTAAYAAALLYSRPPEELQEVERELDIHPSAFGAALSSAAYSLTFYFVDSKSAFTQSEYRDLAHVCRSAKLLMEKIRK